MKHRTSRLLAATAATGAAALVLAGCTTTPSSPESSAAATGGTVTIGVTNAVTSLNSATPQSNLDSNGMVDYLTGNAQGYGSLFTLDADLQLVPDTTNATYELVSEDPLTVTYTVNDGAKWSDGEDITADDLLINWAIGSGYYDDASYDETTGEVTTGTQYFTLAGSTAGLDTTAFPTISDDNKSITLVYDTPYVDWNLVNLIGKPAHVLADKAGLTTEELTTLLTDLPKGDPENPVDANTDLKAVADFWNTGYDITSMPTDESLLVTAGAFMVSEYEPNDGGHLTLVPNPEFAGDAPSYSQLTLSFIADANAQVTALGNGEVDAIQPQASQDTLTALTDAGATVVQGNQLSYDHLDLKMNSDVFSDPNVREAFLLTIPRQQILDAIVTPVDPEAEVLNSQLFVSSQPEYADAVAANGYSDFGDPDIAKAKELLDGATPTVRILYNSENPNRVDSFNAIQASATEAGFQIEDGGSPDWSSELSTNTYDASIFGWISPGVGYAGLPQIWKTGGGGNYNGYSNAEVDKLVDESQVTIDDTAKINDIQIQIDTLTREDFYGLPLFQSPGIFATSSSLTGVSWFSGQTGIVWNALDWTISG